MVHLRVQTVVATGVGDRGFLDGQRGLDGARRRGFVEPREHVLDVLGAGVAGF